MTGHEILGIAFAISFILLVGIGGFLIAKKNTSGKTAYQREKEEGKAYSLPKAFLVSLLCMALAILICAVASLLPWSIWGLM